MPTSMLLGAAPLCQSKLIFLFPLTPALSRKGRGSKNAAARLSFPPSSLSFPTSPPLSFPTFLIGNPVAFLFPVVGAKGYGVTVS